MTCPMHLVLVSEGHLDHQRGAEDLIWESPGEFIQNARLRGRMSPPALSLEVRPYRNLMDGVRDFKHGARDN